MAEGVPPMNTSQRPDPVPPARLSFGESFRLQTWLLGIIGFGILLYMLVQAKFVLISLVIAIILFSLTADAISFVARLRIGPVRIANWLASMVAVLLIASALLTLSGLVLSQINTVLTTTLSYAEQATFAIAQLFSFMGEDVEAAVLASLRSIEISGYLRSAAGQAGNLLSGVVLVILFVAFLFAERLWFEVKLENLLGDRAQAERVRRIIGAIIRSINYYLLVKTAVSAVTGIAIWFIMWMLGLEFAVAMGVITFMLNFIPNIGSIVATLLVAVVTYIQVADPMVTLGVFLIAGAVQFSIGNIIDPWLMGRALRLSSFGIIMSLAFWGLVWGIPGMFLAVPIMVGVMIVCSQIPQARPVAVLLSREGLPDTDTDSQTGVLIAAAPPPPTPARKPAA